MSSDMCEWSLTEENQKKKEVKGAEHLEPRARRATWGGVLSRIRSVYDWGNFQGNGREGSGREHSVLRGGWGRYLDQEKELHGGGVERTSVG